MKLFLELLAVLGTFTVVLAQRAPTPVISPNFDDAGDIQFVHYPLNQDPVTVSDLTLLCPYLSARKRIVFYFYGLTPNSSIHTDFQVIKDAYHAHRDIYSFIVLDIPTKVLDNYPLTSDLDKLKAAGTSIANLINNCNAAYVNNTYFVGFSLGAQIAGYIARQVQVASAGLTKIQRIVALAPSLIPTVNLDPNNPNAAAEFQLSPNDATLVVTVLPDRRWTDRKIAAHATFYPNGDDEPKQTSCYYLDFYHDTRCAVRITQEYYAEAVKSNDQKAFWGISCNNYYEFSNGICNPSNPKCGLNPYILDSCRGKFFFDTNKKSPYRMPNPYGQ